MSNTLERPISLLGRLKNWILVLRQFDLSKPRSSMGELEAIGVTLIFWTAIIGYTLAILACLNLSIVAGIQADLWTIPGKPLSIEKTFVLLLMAAILIQSLHVVSFVKHRWNRPCK